MEPQHMPQPGGPPRSPLLERNTLVMQQVTGFMSNDFDILDESGASLATVSTTNDAGPRWLVGSRSFTVVDAAGQFLMGITDPMDFMRDSYQLADPSGQQFALIRKRFTVMALRATVEISGASTITLSGKPFSMEFAADVDSVEIARATRKWAGFGRGLLGHSRYALEIRPDVRPLDRLGLIGGMVALDLMRNKQSRNN
ncbi:LURP-one-related/scramblase family protein [Kocuria sp. HSID16901]|uniref:LURP-one-related/scramblase family protein n=1 Tax=Kocuria sp. HSID16901 TaxID=2419505 RepID=UPI000F89A511|nr:hypothetical protein [Kocuria sp. HSID16901]MCT1367699.1 hypothetical protein [Rothia sp. p3-SID1597]RUQ20258.1 hypothetical protein D8M21_09795 [Kocuria sp. HSID16901]